ncbi:hypothetical protein GCM10023220_35640 [Streptomyces ziwulingensis]|uniref:Uncharacterized protein n=1 Tax=Streptomyces ziwulingensis TaxID=1045501 RepID=A0ABP9C3X7_9ACTN
MAFQKAEQKAEGERASHARGGSFESAGRPEAQAAAEALASVLSPQEGQDVRDAVADIEPDGVWDRDMDLMKDSTLLCTSDRHRTYGAHPASVRPLLPGSPGSCSDPVPMRAAPLPPASRKPSPSRWTRCRPPCSTPPRPHACRTPPPGV